MILQVTWEAVRSWLYSFGQEYGVDPLIFAILYFGTIPFSLLAFSALVRRYRRGRSIYLPLLVMFLCYIGTYVYLFWVGRQIPAWVYGLVVAVMLYSGFLLVRKVRVVV